MNMLRVLALVAIPLVATAQSQRPAEPLQDCNKQLADRKLPPYDAEGRAGKRILELCRKANRDREDRAALQRAVAGDSRLAAREDALSSCLLLSHLGLEVGEESTTDARLASCIESTDPDLIARNVRERQERETREREEREAEEKRVAAEWAKRPKSVRIGMTAAQVEKTQWGKPESVNTSIGRYGKHEQWVYGNGQYLYFENGVLTNIQQSR